MIEYSTSVDSFKNIDGACRMTLIGKGRLMERARILVKQAFYSSRKLSFVLGRLMIALSFCATGLAADLPLYSWESGVEGWEAADLTLTADSILGVTDGTQSMRLSGLSSTFKNDIGHVEFNYLSPDPFDAMNQAAAAIAAGATDVTLEFDLAVDASSVSVDGYAQIGMFVNSTGVNFQQYGTGNFIGGDTNSTFPLVYHQALDDGATIVNTGGNQYHVAVPLGPTLNIGEGSFFQIGFKSNGVWTGSMDLGIDNMFVSSPNFPEFTEHTLFSWEDGLEGWMSTQDPDPPTQNLSITSTGATDGISAMQLDRTPLADGFTWGSAFALDSDPDGTGVDPVIQAEIDDFVSQINGAAKIAVDITYEDQFPPISPTYSQIWLAFTDETEVWYQQQTADVDEDGGFNINNAAPGTMKTLVFDLDEFYDGGDPNGLNLAIDGLMEGTTQFGIIMGTSTDDGAIYQLDNLRLLTQVLSADFDNDGDVDGTDFLAWQQGSGILSGANHEQGDANLDGAVDGLDMDIWAEQYGTTPLQAGLATVPEPSTILMTLLVSLAMMAGRRRYPLGQGCIY